MFLEPGSAHWGWFLLKDYLDFTLGICIILCSVIFAYFSYECGFHYVLKIQLQDYLPYGWLKGYNTNTLDSALISCVNAYYTNLYQSSQVIVAVALAIVHENNTDGHVSIILSSFFS